jgi:hypothetical protein
LPEQKTKKTKKATKTVQQMTMKKNRTTTTTTRQSARARQSFAQTAQTLVFHSRRTPRHRPDAASWHFCDLPRPATTRAPGWSLAASAGSFPNSTAPHLKIEARQRQSQHFHVHLPQRGDATPSSLLHPFSLLPPFISRGLKKATMERGGKEDFTTTRLN